MDQPGSAQTQPACAREALDLLNCVTESPYDPDKCLRLLQSLRECVLNKSPPRPYCEGLWTSEKLRLKPHLPNPSPLVLPPASPLILRRFSGEREFQPLALSDRPVVLSKLSPATFNPPFHRRCSLFCLYRMPDPVSHMHQPQPNSSIPRLLPFPFRRWPHSVDHNAKFGANNLASQLLEEFQEVADIINF
ncbi:hypothetical protein CJ030_MR8G022217 [Morella rubra]|uniref:CHCH domain-containing protein n=1 Tax=Morella rubra TaxID=262757 RepID=A0A6A1UR20_9ROSI|nr:hypothetical protein CJ030_MR8G022217 [Morella rubra]